MRLFLLRILELNVNGVTRASAFYLLRFVVSVIRDLDQTFNALPSNRSARVVLSSAKPRLDSVACQGDWVLYLVE